MDQCHQIWLASRECSVDFWVNSWPTTQHKLIAKQVYISTKKSTTIAVDRPAIVARNSWLMFLLLYLPRAANPTSIHSASFSPRTCSGKDDFAAWKRRYVVSVSIRKTVLSDISNPQKGRLSHLCSEDQSRLATTCFHVSTHCKL